MEDFNYNEIRQRQVAPNMLKSYGIDIEKAESKKAMTTGNTPGKETVEKGGQGSGRKIGTTRSGKDIMHTFDHSSHEKFTKEDHHDAAEAQGKIADKYADHKDQSKREDSKRASYGYTAHMRAAEEKEGKSDQKTDLHIDKRQAMKDMLEKEKKVEKGSDEAGMNLYASEDKKDVKLALDNKKTLTKGKTMTVDTKEMVDEHKKLTKVLDSPSHKDDKEESEDQKKELKGYEKKLKKSFDVLGVDYIEKGGQGSGRKIGQTSSGKNIYENHEHPSHKDFTAKEHREAAKLHEDNDNVRQANLHSASAKNQEKKSDY